MSYLTSGECPPSPLKWVLLFNGQRNSQQPLSDCLAQGFTEHAQSTLCLSFHLSHLRLTCHLSPHLSLSHRAPSLFLAYLPPYNLNWESALAVRTLRHHLQFIILLNKRSLGFSRFNSENISRVLSGPIDLFFKARWQKLLPLLWQV